VLGLGGVAFGLIEQPHYGWGSPAIFVSLSLGIVAFAGFIAYERRAKQPMLEVELFTHRNFAVGNVETFAMYAGIAILFFFLVIFLQQVAGYSALESGLATVPVTVVLFAFSRRFGALADHHGPRLFMGAGPLIAGAGTLLLLRTGVHTSYVTDVLPAMLVFGVGLALTVAPLVATVLADADEGDAGIASAINNAVARVAGLIGVSLLGVVVAQTLVGDTFAANEESVEAFHQVVLICSALLAVGGVIGAVGIVNPRRALEARTCAGGQLVGVPLPAVASRVGEPAAGVPQTAG
jgi:predicted MFS family arabinose efflux permease